jgi:hypothetical protein
LLQLRPLIQPFIVYKVGNGTSISLWFDNWHPLGPLVERFGSRIAYDSGLSIDSKVSSILNTTHQWQFPITQTWELNEIRSNLPSLIGPSQQCDSCSWTLTKNGLFSIPSLWDKLRTPFHQVNWSHIIWFPAHIPRCSLISWLALQNRLATGDRLVTFGILHASVCSFCSDAETHDHLFFNCPFTKQVWDTVSLKSQLSWQPQPLASLVSLISIYKGKGLNSTLVKLSFTVTLYHIWIERNLRKFQNLQHPIPTVVEKICRDVRYKLMSLSTLPSGPQTLRDSWNLSSLNA